MGTLQERATTQSVIGGGGQERTGERGRGLGVIYIYGSGVMSSSWSVTTGHYSTKWDLLCIYWITNEPCITLPSSLHILNTLGIFNFVLLLFLHKTIPLEQSCLVQATAVVSFLKIYKAAVFA